MTINTFPVDIATSSNITNPPAGFVRLYADTTGNLFTRDSNGIVYSANSDPYVIFNTRFTAATLTGTSSNPNIFGSISLPPGRTAVIRGNLRLQSNTTNDAITAALRVTHPSGGTSATVNGPTQVVGGTWLTIANATGNSVASNYYTSQAQILTATGNSQTVTVSQASGVTTGNIGAFYNAIIKNLTNNVTATIDIMTYSGGGSYFIYGGSTVIAEMVAS